MKTKNLKLKIYRIVSRIPPGKAMTYGQVAKITGTSPRAVGRILHQNKDPKNIPCHRVVFSDGSLSKSYAFGGLKKQKERLEKEQVKFFRGKVVLDE